MKGYPPGEFSQDRQDLLGISSEGRGVSEQFAQACRRAEPARQRIAGFRSELAEDHRPHHASDGRRPRHYPSFRPHGPAPRQRQRVSGGPAFAVDNGQVIAPVCGTRLAECHDQRRLTRQRGAGQQQDLIAPADRASVEKDALAAMLRDPKVKVIGQLFLGSKKGGGTLQGDAVSPRLIQPTGAMLDQEPRAGLAGCDGSRFCWQMLLLKLQQLFRRFTLDDHLDALDQESGLYHRVHVASYVG